MTNRREVPKPLNATETFLYCIIERLDILIDAKEEKKVEPQEVPQSKPAPKRKSATPKKSN